MNSKVIPDLNPDILQRFWSKIIKTGNCWEWTACVLKNGYGQFTIDQKLYYAHRVSYAIFIGDIPNNLHLDHLCRNRKCVNPDHLEPVTNEENIRRGLTGLQRGFQQKSKTHCLKGHPYSGNNLYLRKDRDGRECKKCKRINEKNRRLIKSRGKI